MLLLLGAAFVLAAAGCGSGGRTLYHVSGTVTFDGNPVPAGFVVFDPDVSVGNDGTQGYAEIKDGSFSTADTGQGVSGGDYIVRVRGFVPPAGEAPGEMLFRDYEEAVELPTANSRQEIVVPASARAESGTLPGPT